MLFKLKFSRPTLEDVLPNFEALWRRTWRHMMYHHGAKGFRDQASKGAKQAPTLKSPDGSRRLKTLLMKGDNCRSFGRREVEKGRNTHQADIKIHLANKEGTENKEECSSAKSPSNSLH